MEVRTAGGVLLPTIYRSFARQSSVRCAASPFTRSLQQHSRCLSSSQFRRQDQPASKPSSDEMPSTTAAPQPSVYSSMIDQALDFTKRPPAASQTRTSHFESSRLPASVKSKSSLDDLAASFTAPRRPNNAFNIANMLDPANRTGALSPSNKPEPVRMPEPLPEYGPSVGRTVAVDPNRGMDVGRAFRSLEMNCARNRIRADFNRQRFHERPGLKRKRLRSERWRRRFKEGFRGMVKMVNAMKKQGW